MRLLIYSPVFYPMIGGMETVIELLARQFSKDGLEVKLICKAPDDGTKIFPFEVIRNPSWWRTLQLFRWADVVHYANVSLKGLYPLLLAPRPVVTAHHSALTTEKRHQGFRVRLKQVVCRFMTNSSCSQAIADTLAVPTTVITNPYNDEIFKLYPDVPRDLDLVFVGRLVSDKGADLLLHAIAKLLEDKINTSTSIIGSGPELPRLQNLAEQLGIANLVNFTGPKRGEELARYINRHQIMVIPSLWAEPFGVVALEGAACGCVIVGSKRGGLSDAIGPCGITFENGNCSELVQSLKQMLSDPKGREQYRRQAPAHLKRHGKEEIARAYEKLFHVAMTADRSANAN